MTQYTIAERQTIKDQLADEKYFRADLELLRRNILIMYCSMSASVQII